MQEQEQVWPDQVETNLLSCIKTPEDLALVIKAQVSEKYFIVYPTAFQYLVDHVKSFSEVPAAQLLEGKEEDLQLISDVEGLTSWVEELINLYLAREVATAIDRNLGKNKLDENPRANTRALTMDLNLLLRSRTVNTARSDRDSARRLESYHKRKELAKSNTLLGMPTGLKCFDEYQEGWEPGECIMILGPKGIGKSWVMMNFACTAYVSGKKVLFLSPEMSWKECELRFDIITSNKMGMNWGTHWDLKQGRRIDETVYANFLAAVSAREDFTLIDSDISGGFNLNGIVAMIEEHQPDLVLLDGIHLIQEDKGDHWQQIKSCADGLKSLAQLKGIVIIWSGQVEKAAMKDAYEPVDSGAYAAYAKASVEAANRVLSFAADKHDKMYRWFKVINSRDGREWGNKQRLLFDVNQGHIEQEYVDEDGFTDPF